MDNLEVIARLKIRPGQLEGFKSQMADILRATRETEQSARSTSCFPMNRD